MFRMSRWARLRHIVLPQLSPYIASAGRSGIALIWKIVLVVEFLGRPDGIGFRIHRFFQGIAQRGELKLADAVWQKKKRESLTALDPKRRERELLCFHFFEP